MSDTYTVVATIQSPGNDPVDMKWYSGPDPLKAMVAVGQTLDHHADESATPVPVRLRAVTITITEE